MDDDARERTKTARPSTPAGVGAGVTHREIHERLGALVEVHCESSAVAGLVGLSCVVSAFIGAVILGIGGRGAFSGVLLFAGVAGMFVTATLSKHRWRVYADGLVEKLGPITLLEIEWGQIRGATEMHPAYTRLGSVMTFNDGRVVTFDVAGFGSGRLVLPVDRLANRIAALAGVTIEIDMREPPELSCSCG